MRSCQLSDEELAKLYRWTLNTKWGVSGAPVSGIGADDDSPACATAAASRAGIVGLGNNRHDRCYRIPQQCNCCLLQ